MKKYIKGQHDDDIYAQNRPRDDNDQKMKRRTDIYIYQRVKLHGWLATEKQAELIMNIFRTID